MSEFVRKVISDQWAKADSAVCLDAHFGVYCIWTQFIEWGQIDDDIDLQSGHQQHRPEHNRAGGWEPRY